MQRFVNYFQQWGEFQRNARLYLLSNVLSGMTLGIFLVLYNLYLTSLGYNADFVGAVLFAGTLGAALAIFPAGLCIDRWSGKWILICSNVMIALVGIGTILFHQPFPLLCCAFITGIAGAFSLVINAPFLSRNSQPDERSLLFSLNIGLTQITTVLGEVLGGLLPGWFLHSSWWMAPLPAWLNWLLVGAAQPRSYQLALLAAGIIAAPGFIPLFLMTHDHPAPLAKRERTGSFRQRSGLRWQAWSAQSRLWLQPVNLRRFLMSSFFILALVQALTGLGAGLIIPYFNLFFVNHLHATTALFGLIDGTANGLTALTTLLAPWLARRIGKINSIMLTRLISLPLLLAVGFASSLPLALLFYPLREGVMDMSQGVLQVFSMEEIPEQHRGLANSAYQATYQIAWAITASLGGLIIVSVGYSPLFLGTGACYLAAIGFLWGKFGGKRQKSETPLVRS